VDLTHKPIVLYHASIERMNTARQLLLGPKPDYPMAMYNAGLAVECLLQAFALRAGQAHDARHSLINWLTKCPSGLQDRIKTNVRAQWSFVAAIWDNEIRYLSTAGLLGYLRQKGYTRAISGGPDAMIRTNAKAMVQAAEAVHDAGVVVWVSSTGK
jgi:hypothetical protein